MGSGHSGQYQLDSQDFRNSACLFRCDRAHDTAALLRRWCFEFSDLHEIVDHTLHHPSAFLNVRDLAAAEYDRHLNFVLVGQELSRLLDLEIYVVLPRLGTQSNFFRLRVMNVALAGFLVALVLALASF